MMFAQRICFVACVGLLGINTAAAETLQNDGFQTNAAVGFQSGFVIGESAAVELKTGDGGSWQVDQVLLLFGGATTQRTVTVTIYEASPNATPGSVLFSGDFQVTGSNENMSAIDLSSESVVVSGEFRVGIGFQHAGLPSVARDDDGTIAKDLNYIEANGIGWIESSLLGLSGDWIIRAEVTKIGGAPDAGMGPDGGSGVLDAGIGSDAGSSADPDAGSVSDSCSLHSDCQRGAHCSDQSVCTVECRAEIDCSGDSVCDTELGRCDAKESSDGGCSSSGAGSGVGGALLLMLSIVGMRRRRRA